VKKLVAIIVGGTGQFGLTIANQLLKKIIITLIKYYLNESKS